MAKEYTFKDCKGIEDAYKLYKGPIAYKTYAQVLKAFNQRLVDKLLFDNFEFTLPYRLGTLRIRKMKNRIADPSYGKKATRFLKVDWANTKKYGKKVYHLNTHTKGYYFRMFWKKADAVFKNKSAYSFTPVRKVKRGLAAIALDPSRSIDYFE